MHLFATTRDADKYEPPFFFKSIWSMKASFMRKNAILHRYDVNDWKFKSFDCMERHERHPVSHGFPRVGIGHECCGFQKSFEGIGADMLEEFRLAYVAHRANDVTASPEAAWQWLANGWQLVPEALSDEVTWNYDHVDSPWHVAFTPGIRALDVRNGDGDLLLDNGVCTRVDITEVRAKAAEQAVRLFSRL